MLDPTHFTSEAEYVAAVKAEEDGTPHGDDPAKAIEHQALFDLVPRSEATHIAVSNGSWFDPSTWFEGRIPLAGSKVLIPEAITVNYDATSNTSLFTVRVDGKLAFATDADTLIKVDTLVIGSTGKLEIGTETEPVQSGFTAHILIANNGPIDVTWDPLLLSRGLISHGEVTIHGQEKDSHLKVAVDAMRGDTHLILEESPDGWQVGDRIVLTGTHFVPRRDGEYQGTQDEELTISGINGNIVTLDRPLSFDHDTPRADLNAYVANYSRNVIISTEQADELPVHQRGHTMFMHSDDVDIRYAEFNELGRTNKAERSVDAALVEDMQVDTNVQGRYSVHLHRAGANGEDDPAILIGNAVWGSPGWGFTNHQSHALLENNAAYNTFGAGFVAETGNEIGAWRNNIAIKAEGVDQHFKNAADEKAFDFGRTGDGFWFQGRLIEAEGNIAAGVTHGFIFMHRGMSPDLGSGVSAGNLDQPEIFRYDGSAGQVHRPPIQHFIDNEVLASAHGFLVVKNGGQNQEHDVRSVIENFTAWEVASGVLTQYTAHYTFLNLDLLGTTSSETSFGVNFSINSFDMVINGATIEGFRYGIAMKKSSTSSIDVSNDQFGYVLIDVDAGSSIIAPYLYFDSAVDTLISSGDLSLGRLQLKLAWHEIPLWDWSGGRSVYIEGVKTDSIGAVPYPSGVDLHEVGVSQMSGLLSQEGYHTTADGRRIVIVEEYFADRATGELMKIGIPIQLSEDVPLTQGTFLPHGDAIYRGEIDLDSAAPIATDDSVTMMRDISVEIHVLLNDWDLDSNGIWIDGLTQPRHGKVQALSQNTIAYSPDRDFAGLDSFHYWVTDGNGSYSRATVRLLSKS